MAITKVGSADAAAASVALPAFTAGDLAICFAFRDGTSTQPSVAAGWTNFASSSGTTACSWRAGYRILQAGDTTTGTWTNATDIEVIVLRGFDPVDWILFAAQSAAQSASMSFPSVGLSEADGSSWYVLFGGHRTATDANSVALTGTTNESPANGALALHTIQGTSSPWSTTAKTVNANSGWGTLVVEVRAVPASTHFVSTEPVEVLVLPIPNLRESTEPVDVLLLPIPYLRESVEPVDVLIYPICYARMSVQSVDVLVLPSTTTGRLSVEPVDVLIVPTDQKARMSQEWVDVLSIMHYDRITVFWEEEK